MNRIKTELKWWANKLFFRAYRYRRTERRHLLPAYTADSTPSSTSQRILVMMNDGKRLHGGIADRLRAIVSLYSVCRDRGIRFAINFTYPFALEKYLQPAEYDWRLSPGELSFNPTCSRPFFTDTIGIKGPREVRWEKDYVINHIIGSGKQQMHVYSPFDFADNDFTSLFSELFRPSDLLSQALTPHRAFLGKDYISVSTRFLELLGDFHEPKSKGTLTEPQRSKLIEACLQQLRHIHDRNPGIKILVTSDSQRFLQACRDLPWAYIVEGEIAHSDTSDTDNHLKTFIDFWLISEARHVYQLRTGSMYAGNFSLKAAKAGNRPHTLIEF